MYPTASSPKHLGYGITSGVGNIVGAAVGTAGILVMAPTLGLGVGLAQGGILGGAVGLVGGEMSNIVSYLDKAVDLTSRSKLCIFHPPQGLLRGWSVAPH